jgi:hypothetical protein
VEPPETVAEFLARAPVEWPIVLSFPCGNRYEYDRAEEVPDADTACRCGSPKHWVVRTGPWNKPDASL